jgi:predicted transcriptional regulator
MPMKAMKIATVPPPSVQAECTVKEALPALTRQHGCTLAVMEGDRLVGTLSKDDVLSKTISMGLDPAYTKVGQVMNSQAAATISIDAEAKEALAWMLSNRKCYLGLVDNEGILRGWLAICALVEYGIEDLARELDSLART